MPARYALRAPATRSAPARHLGSLARRRPTRRPALRQSALGAILLRWGLFNVIEGTVDHEILQVHHVCQNGNHLLWDAVFLAVGACFVLLGPLAIRQGFRETALAVENLQPRL